ncbi:hypothetical protein JCM33374_g1990 [Metschnikowia sp. JCM 33374]|nr:hypothetical protein JCM33374_g1990 [Metschnikowia sp. JCM 33374]
MRLSWWFTLHGLVAGAIALSYEERQKNRPNEVQKKRSQNGDPHSVISVENSFEELYFHKKEYKTETFALAIPENPMGIVLGRLMISEMHNSYQQYGFQPVALFLQYSSWAFTQIDIPLQAKTSVIYATRYDKQLEVVNTEKVWVGLFRHGQLINKTDPFVRGKQTANSPMEVFYELNTQNELALHDMKKVWQTQPGDLLVIAWADLPRSFEEIVKLAVRICESSMFPISYITASLRDCFDKGRSKGKPFAAIRMT